MPNRDCTRCSCAPSIVRALDIPDEPQSRQFWRHAIAVGLTAESLARAGRSHCGVTFAAGLLHNVGRLALAQLVPSVLDDLRAHARREGIGLHCAERELFGFTDAELGSALAARWHFPTEMTIAVSRYAEDDARASDDDSLAALLARARALVEVEGLHDGLEPAQALPAGHLPDVDWIALDDGFDALLGRVDAFMEHSGIT